MGPGSDKEGGAGKEEQATARAEVTSTSGRSSLRCAAFCSVRLVEKYLGSKADGDFFVFVIQGLLFP